MQSSIIVNLIIVISGATADFDSSKLIQESDGSSVTQAEVTGESFGGNKDADSAKGDSATTTEEASKRAELPSWLSDALTGTTKKGDHQHVVVSTPHVDVADCEIDLNEKVCAEVLAYIDKNLLTLVNSEELEQLTKEFIETNILEPHKDQVFRKAETRPGGEMFQIYRLITIDKSVVNKILSWENRIVVERRTTEVGVSGGIALAGMGLLSGLVGLLARREKAKL